METIIVIGLPTSLNFNYDLKQCKQHPDEHCSFICTEPECLDNRIICSECCFTNHTAHEIRSLRVTLDDIAGDIEPHGRILTLVALIDGLYFRFRNVLKEARIVEEQLEGQLKRFFESIRRQVENYGRICRQIITAQRKGEELNKIFKYYHFFKREESQNKANFQLFLEDIHSYLEEKLETLETELAERAESRNILRVLVPYEIQRAITYHFSAKDKQSSIKITNHGLTATQDKTYNNNVALIEPMIQGKRKLRGKRSIRFKIGKGLSWLSVGVAYAAIIRKASYQLNTSNIGHGAYMASFQGYCFHNDDPALNSQIHDFTFLEGDVITVTVNSSSERILFEKQGGGSVGMPFKRRPGEDLNFCVWLRNPQESVSILK